MDNNNTNTETFAASAEHVVPKKKKGRPRKNLESPPILQLDTTEHATANNQLSSITEEDKPKSKRGRKKKEPVEEEVKVKKKRGRKAALKFYSSSIRKKIPITTDLQNTENVILHLKMEAESTDQSNQHYKKLNANEKSYCELENNTDDSCNDDESSDLIESYLQEIEQHPESTMKSLYNQKLEQRTKQDNEFLEKLQTHQLSEEDISKLEKKFFSKDRPDSIHKEQVHEQEVRVDTDIVEKDRKNGFITVLHPLVVNKHWPEKVRDVRCWWCCHYFDSVPVGLPVKYDERTGKFHCKGIFCGIECTLAYYRDRYREFKSNNYSLIKYMYSKCYGATIDEPLMPAPPRESLLEFGGGLTIEEFRSATQNKKLYKMLPYPMIVVREYIEEIDINALKERNKKVVVPTKLKLQEDKVQEARERLNQIETNSMSNTIDKFLNLKF